MLVTMTPPFPRGSPVTLCLLWWETIRRRSGGGGGGSERSGSEQPGKSSCSCGDPRRRWEVSTTLWSGRNDSYPLRMSDPESDSLTDFWNFLRAPIYFWFLGRSSLPLASSFHMFFDLTTSVSPIFTERAWLVICFWHDSFLDSFYSLTLISLDNPSLEGRAPRKESLRWRSDLIVLWVFTEVEAHGGKWRRKQGLLQEKKLSGCFFTSSYWFLLHWYRRRSANFIRAAFDWKPHLKPSDGSQIKVIFFTVDGKLRQPGSPGPSKDTAPEFGHKVMSVMSW